MFKKTIEGDHFAVFCLFICLFVAFLFFFVVFFFWWGSGLGSVNSLVIKFIDFVSVFVIIFVMFFFSYSCYPTFVFFFF